MHVVRMILAWVVAAITMAASISGLYSVATDKAQMAPLAAGAIVAGFDVTAVVAGMKVVECPRKVSAWLMLAGMAAASAAAQILAASEGLGPWRLLHGAAPVAAIWTLHAAVTDTRSDTETAGPATQKKKNQGTHTVARPTPAKPTAPGRSAAGVPKGDGAPGATSLTGQEGEHRPPPAGAPPSNPSDVVRLLEGAGESCTKAAVMRVTGWGSGRALKIMPDVEALMSKSNVRPLRPEKDQAHG